MARTKSKRGKKHKEIKKKAKGFGQARRKRVKIAKESLLHQGQYQYIGRKLRKRDLRKLWITRVNAAARQHGLSYNKFIHGLKEAGIEIDRKMLAEMAVNNPEDFEKIVEEIK